MTIKSIFLLCVTIAVTFAEPPVPATKSQGYHYDAPKKSEGYSYEPPKQAAQLYSKAPEYQSAVIYATVQKPNDAHGQQLKYVAPIVQVQKSHHHEGHQNLLSTSAQKFEHHEHHQGHHDQQHAVQYQPQQVQHVEYQPQHVQHVEYQPQHAHQHTVPHQPQVHQNAVEYQPQHAHQHTVEYQPQQVHQHAVEYQPQHAHEHAVQPQQVHHHAVEYQPQNGHQHTVQHQHAVEYQPQHAHQHTVQHQHAVEYQPQHAQQHTVQYQPQQAHQHAVLYQPQHDHQHAVQHQPQHAVVYQPQPAPHYHHEPQHAGQNHHEPHHYAPAHYSFEYGVNDPHTGDIKEQKESRNGDHVQGYYSLIEADGTKRIVHYSDEGHGFNAVVSHEGHSHHVKHVPVKAVVPVAHVPVKAVVPVVPVAHVVPAKGYLPAASGFGPTGPAQTYQTAHGSDVEHSVHKVAVIKVQPVAQYAHGSSSGHHGLSSGAATSFISGSSTDAHHEAHKISTHITHIVPHHHH